MGAVIDTCYDNFKATILPNRHTFKLGETTLQDDIYTLPQPQTKHSMIMPSKGKI